ncbi:MAG: hypothetical protein AAB373_01120 [Patescibacteria group bacterium]
MDFAGNLEWWVYVLIALWFAGCGFVIYKDFKSWLRQTILLILILPLPYLFCFDDCGWGTAPLILPGLHWVAFVGTLTSALIYFVEFALVLKAFDYFKKKYNQSVRFWNIARCILIVVVWFLIFISGRFQSEAVFNLVNNVTAKMNEGELEEALERIALADQKSKLFYDEFDLGANEKSFDFNKENFDRVEDDIIIGVYPYGEEEYLAFSIPNEFGSMAGSEGKYISSDEVLENILYSKENMYIRDNIGFPGLKLRFDRCYIESYHYDLFCFNKGKLDLKTYNRRLPREPNFFEMNPELVR